MAKVRALFGEEGEHRLARLLLVPCNQRLSCSQLGELMGVTADTIRRHKPAALELMASWQLEPVSPADLIVVERALLSEAQAGNVPAAKMLFDRLKAAAGALIKAPAEEEEPLPTVAELEAALAMIKGG